MSSTPSNTVNNVACRPEAAYPTGAVTIPPAAFADPNNPTDVEAQAYADSLTERPNTMFVYGGGPDMPEYAWIEDVAGDLTRVESPPGQPQALIDIIQSYPLMVTSGESSIPTREIGSIVNYQWTVRNPVTAIVDCVISGAAGADASGESCVSSGNYENPTWTFSRCGDFEFCLEVTDDLGRTSQPHCSYVNGWGEVELVFPNTGDLFVMSLTHSGVYVTHWDMGDGTEYDTNNVNHDYGGPGNFVARATVCYPRLAQIFLSSLATTVVSMERVFENLPIRYFNLLNLISFRGNNNNSSATGDLPVNWDWSDNINLTDIDIRNITGTGFTGGIPDISNLTNLELFILGNNDFQGSVPSTTNNPSLVQFSVADNEDLGGTVDFSNNPLLEQVFLQSTSIIGNLDVSNNPLLTILRASNLDLSTGNFDFQFNPNLEILELANWSNVVPGQTVPNASFTLSTSLRELTIENLLMVGNAPDLSNNTVLEILNLSGNDFVGNYPDLDNSPILQSYEVDGDNFTGYVGGNAPATLLNVITQQSPATPAATNDALFCAVDAAGSNNGYMEWRGTRTPVGDVCAANMIVRGWTIVLIP